MITLEHKKLIAEKVMGWELKIDNWQRETFWKNGNQMVVVNDFDVTRHWFYEILGKLEGDDIKMRVEEICNPEDWLVNSVVWVHNNREFIITALIEVLEGQEG